MQGTWAHVGVNSCTLACGRCLLHRRPSPGRVWGSSSGAQRCLGSWHGHLDKGPRVRMNRTRVLSGPGLSCKRELVSRCNLIPCLVYSEAAKGGPGLLVSLLSLTGPLLGFLETQTPLQPSLLRTCVWSLLKRSDRFSHPKNLPKTLLFNFFFFCFSPHVFLFHSFFPLSVCHEQLK